MLNKITEIFTEEEIVEAILLNGDETKVASLIADEEFIKKYIDFMLENEDNLDRIYDVVENTTSPEILHTIAVALIKADIDEQLLDKILEHPYCSGKTIVYAEEEHYRIWTGNAIYEYSDSFKKSYSKEKLWEIAMADKNGSCSVGIIEFSNCDEELFYKIFEKRKGNASDYSDICGMALVRKYTLRQDILEEILENLLVCLDLDIAYIVEECNDDYLERVMAKIEENASEDVREIARAAYAERKKGSE